MNNKRLIQIQEKLEKLKKLDKKYQIFGSNKHKYVLNSKKNSEELIQFETFHKLTLPEQYKAYLSRIANGGTGPYYGLFSLEKGIEESEKYSAEENNANTNIFSKEFPIDNKNTKKFIDYYNECLEEGDDDEIVYLDVPDSLTGAIFLSDYGCGWNYVLVVKGEQAGKVWLTGDYLSPCFSKNTQWEFFDWYENWLDRSLEELNPSSGVKPFDKNTKIITYDGWRLKKIPKEVFDCKNLKKFVFSRNDLPEFPKEILQFNELRTLDLSMTPIIDIPEKISDLKNLKKLRLNYNYHIKLPESLDGLKNLEELSMYYNYKLKEIPEVVGKIVSLKQIIFSYCPDLKKLPENIGNLKNLESLKLNDCTSLEILPNSIVNLENLNSLYLGRTKIKKLPHGFEKLKNLEILEIDIEELDLLDAIQMLKNLPKLKYLKISTQLNYPESFKELENLKTLVITQNYTLWHKGYKTMPIPEQITLIPHLEILDLRNNNQAKSLPSNIGNMSSLRELYIGATSINEFPNSLQKLTYLEKIEGNLATQLKSPFGISIKEKEKVRKWFPKAKIWIF